MLLFCHHGFFELGYAAECSTIEICIVLVYSNSYLHIIKVSRY